MSITRDYRRLPGCSLGFPFFYRFLRRAIGIKASYYSRVSNIDVWTQASRPHRPSETIKKTQFNMLREVFSQNMDSPAHNVVFCTGLKDSIFTQGRRRGMQFPYWIEVMIKRYYPDLSNHNTGIQGPNFRYVLLYRALQSLPEMAPKRARASTEKRAHGPSKNP